MVDFDYFLNRKYAQLQQQADATTRNAQTNALTGAAAAQLDTTRAALLPGESKATIAKMGAETGLIGEQAKIVAPESAARIAGINADTALTRTTRDVSLRQNLTPLSQNFGSGLNSFARLVTGGGAPSTGFRTTEITPASTRRAAAGSAPGRMSVAELDAQQPPWRF